MKKTIKIVIIVLFAILLLYWLGLSLYTRFGGYYLLDEEARTELVDAVKASPVLPERFYELYDFANPGELDSNAFARYVNVCLLDNFDTSIPSVGIAFMERNNMGSDLSHLMFYLEDKTTQRECLNYLTDHFHFSKNGVKATNMHNSAKAFFRKELNDLNDKQMLFLIISFKNPGFDADGVADNLMKEMEGNNK